MRLNSLNSGERGAVLFTLHTEDSERVKQLGEVTECNGILIQTFSSNICAFFPSLLPTEWSGSILGGWTVFFSLNTYSTWLLQNFHSRNTRSTHFIICIPRVISSTKLVIFWEVGEGFGCFPAFYLSPILPCKYWVAWWEAMISEAIKKQGHHKQNGVWCGQC